MIAEVRFPACICVGIVQPCAAGVPVGTAHLKPAEQLPLRQSAFPVLASAGSRSVLELDQSSSPACQSFPVCRLSSLLGESSRVLFEQDETISVISFYINIFILP